jgi:alpha-tubulin suppressor-like RCC1 family protein
MMKHIRRCRLLVPIAMLVAALPAGDAAAVETGVNGSPWTWGGNTYGELGNGTTTPRLSPGAVNLSDVVDIHGGREHVIALRSDGTVWTWGSNASGQLGLGPTTNRSVPTRVTAVANVVAVETGHNFSMALRSNGTVWTWGMNADGQLGDGTTTQRSSPVQVAGLTDAVAIAGGRDMGYAIRANGTVVGWGANSEGQIGDGTTTRRLVPVPVGNLSNVTHIAGGRDHGLARRSDGSVWAWGRNDRGQVGDGTTTNRTAPVQVTSGVIDVAAGAFHSYALRSDGRVSAWGANDRAQLGDGTTTARPRPVAVLTVADAVSIGSARDAGMVTRSDGRVMTWGHNASGQLGDGTTTNRTSGIVVPGVNSAVKAAGGGSQYMVALVGVSAPPANKAPVASFTRVCSQLACTFDASGSSDPDGLVASYAWDFGDGSTATVPKPSHTFATGGSYQVRLTVTDDRGGTDSAAAAVTVSSTTTVTPAVFRASAGTDANTTSPNVMVPSTVRAGDRMVLFMSFARDATFTTPTGWTLIGSVFDGTNLVSRVFTKVAGAGDPGSTVRSALDAYTKTSMILLAYGNAGTVHSVTGVAEAGSGATHATPAAPGTAAAGATVVRYWVDKSSTLHSWTLPSGLAARTATVGTGGGLLSAASGDTTLATTGAVGALSATAGVASAHAIGWTVVITPAP